MNAIPCCEKMREALTTNSYGTASPQIVFVDGVWNILGCCSDGCYVASEIKFCPWCARPLGEKVADSRARCLKCGALAHPVGPGFVMQSCGVCGASLIRPALDAGKAALETCAHCAAGDAPIGHLYHFTDDGRPSCGNCQCCDCLAGKAGQEPDYPVPGTEHTRGDHALADGHGLCGAPWSLHELINPNSKSGVKIWKCPQPRAKAEAIEP